MRERSASRCAEIFLHIWKLQKNFKQMKNRMTFHLILILLLGAATGQSQNLGADYARAWENFYPSPAVALGKHAYIFHFEDYSIQSIEDWLAYNKAEFSRLNDPNTAYAKEYPINTRLLLRQMREEIDYWENQAPHRHKLTFYTRALQSAWSTVLNADYLTGPERARLLCSRLGASDEIVEAALENLKELDKVDAERGISSLQTLQRYLKETLLQEAISLNVETVCPDFPADLQQYIGKLKGLETYVDKELLPKAKTRSPLLGREAYARQLDLYTDGQLSPEELERIALEEIKETINIIQQVSREYLEETYPDEVIPDTEWISRAFADMEKDAPKNGAEYKAFWLDLAEAAVAFIEEHDIATLPAYQTLRIDNAPESAGAAARIGWVDSAAPFAPNPVTTLYLPSIPDTLPEQEQIDFWSSFNKPFNRMIVIHELFPGHYMQIKISRETPHPLRLLFPYSPYIEGWATFTEKVLLDAGWEKERKLTYLAHLRKRLENANRAYTSVQVHCKGWTQEQVMQFSTETALLAPQFAKSLWGRIMRSPMQLTSYFWGGQQFKELLQREQERLADRFELKRFMDTIMQAGPIPIDAFDTLFQTIITD
jgi:hypothetical protein